MALLTLFSRNSTALSQPGTFEQVPVIDLEPDYDRDTLGDQPQLPTRMQQRRTRRRGFQSSLDRDAFGLDPV